jgi:hypothetical protein
MNTQQSKGYKLLQINFLILAIMLHDQIITTSTVRESYKTFQNLGLCRVKCFSDGGEMCALVSNSSGKYLKYLPLAAKFVGLAGRQD